MPDEKPSTEEVQAALERAAQDLEAANKRATEAEAALAARTARVGELEASANELVADFRKLEARANRAEAERDALAARVKELEKAAKASAKSDKAKPSPVPGEQTATVLRGTVHHPKADNGQARVGESFPVTDEEAAELDRLVRRGVISLEP